ncbi:MAG TPA: esterase-like activity of phytase family protein [Thermoleophilaceae bacterium]|jgi:hypothetical protein
MHSFKRRRYLAIAGPLVVLAAVLAVIVGQAVAGPSNPPAHANPDSYNTGNVGTLAVGESHGVLANDQGHDIQLVGNSDPSHGSLTLNRDGSFEYVPQSGFTGDDSFDYTISNAVHLFKTNLPPLGFFGGVTLTGGAFGSSLYPAPGHHDDEFYGLEDRGPNVAAPNGHDVLPIPSYDPAIAKFRFKDGKAKLLKTIPLRDASGHPYSGLVNTDNTTGETVEDLNGHVLANDPNGYDPEGLVALPDGTFWVSDEYGPFITHFRSDGRAIQRLSPLDGSLPKELLKRVPNRGMEGLTITPDGKTLVGTMQSGLQQDDLAGADAKKIAPIRIVTYGLKNHQLHEYLYLLHDPKTTGTAVSEITALSNTTFLMDERDGAFPSATGFKQLWKIDISHATDVGPNANVSGANYDATHGGLLVGGQTIEKLTNGELTADAANTLAAAHITPVAESLFLNVDQLLLSLDPQGRFFSHDKLEGVAAFDGGKKIVISNDSDFGISGVTNAAPPWTLQAKISPATHKQDDGEYLEIDTDHLASGTSTATATIHVHSGP